MDAATINLTDEIVELKKSNLQLQQFLAQKEEIIAQKQQQIEQLLELFRLQRHHQFGASSEQAPGQGHLFNEVENLAAEAFEAVAENDGNQAAGDEAKTGPSHGCRQPLPAALPRVNVIHDLAETEKRCACGCQRREIGEIISEQLDIIPAQVRVIRHIRKKYACAHCESAPITAVLPPQPIPKSNASPGLLAHIAVAKYQDALPLHRQESILRRAGIDLSRQTLARWMIQSARLLQPLHNLLRDYLLVGPVIHCDETVVQVLKEPDKLPTSQSYMWVQSGGPPNKAVTLFDYRASRSGRVPLELLQDYRGYLMSDGYEGYNAIAQQDGVEHLCCWTHVRRKFIEAQLAQPRSKSTKSQVVGKADVALNFIGKLYGVEQYDDDAIARYRRRQQESVPLLDQMRAWLDSTVNTVTPSGKLGEALQYLHKYWHKLIRYTERGDLPIDNNRAENAIRPFVVGRKNWLFSDTPQGANASAIIYSVIETAKANGLEPYAYLRRLFTALPSATTVEATEQLLPWNMAYIKLQ
jgi:transposase